MPGISSALANLMSTQSPVLRRKIGSLVPESATGSRLDQVSDEVHRRTLVLLLRATHNQSTKTCLPRAKDQNTQALGLVFSQGGSSVSEEHTRHDFIDHASQGFVGEALDWQRNGQSREGMSAHPDREHMHLEPETRCGFLPYEASSGQNDRIMFARDEIQIPSGTEKEKAELMDDDVVPHTPENFPEYGGLYTDLYAEDEVFDLTYGEEQYQEQTVAPESAYNESVMERTDFYHGRDLYGHYYEVPNIERGVSTTTQPYEDYSDEPYETSGIFEDAFHGGHGDEYLDLMEEENRASNDVYEYQDVDDMESNEAQFSPWQNSNGYSQDSLLIASGDQVGMLHGDDIDDEECHNYVAGGRFHESDQVEEAEGDVDLGFCGRLPQNWSQIPRFYNS